jgi:hypothetical protein
MLRVKTAFTMLLMISAICLAACGGDDEGNGGTTTSANDGGQPILIKTRLAPLNARGESTGRVLSGSTIGDSAFCAGGEFLDGPVKPSTRSVVRSFRCSDGTLTITFTSTPPDVPQRSDWKVVKGLGGFEGLAGGGRMRGVLDSGDEGGRETFTGTVTR